MYKNVFFGGDGDGDLGVGPDPADIRAESAGYRDRGGAGCRSYRSPIDQSASREPIVD